MLSYKKHSTFKEPAHSESLIYDLPATTPSTEDVTVQESFVYDHPVATPTSDDVIIVQDNAAYTVFKNNL